MQTIQQSNGLQRRCNGVLNLVVVSVLLDWRCDLFLSGRGCSEIRGSPFNLEVALVTDGPWNVCTDLSNDKLCALAELHS